MAYSEKVPGGMVEAGSKLLNIFQIFELEKRFLYQKYLSPADRDEIAAQLGLSNAQVGENI